MYELHCSVLRRQKPGTTGVEPFPLGAVVIFGDVTPLETLTQPN